ncbi:MAG: tetratricopeptide repeat protein [Acidobacteria bacterium]|nr:tetratricopeptide repeat protein [Acidobacteriota bacterium]
MAQQASNRSAVSNRQPVAGLGASNNRLALIGVLFVLAAAMVLSLPATLNAESLASKNREGNRLFDQGKFEAAENAYLEAQVKNPGRPEVLYNLGNSLIKQGKYDQGMQLLRQSQDKGNKEIKKNSLYNTGNALFSMGNYEDSAGAFVEALKLDSSDTEAKHNLELALKKLKQQQRNQSDSNQKKQDSKTSASSQASSGESGGEQQSQEISRDHAGNGKEKDKPLKQQTLQQSQRDGSIGKEQAAQILDALRNQEIEQQRKLMESRARRKVNEKDW